MNSEISPSVQLALNKAAGFAGKYHTQYITPEIFLQGLLSLERFRSVLEGFATSLAEAGKDLAGYIAANVEKADGEIKELELSYQLMQVLQMADVQVSQSGADRIAVPHIIYAFYQLEDSYAAFWLKKYVTPAQGDLLSALNEAYADEPSGTEAQGTGDESQKAWMRYCRPLVTEPDWRLIGREKEIARALLVLCRKQKGNPVFVGEHGVGKTAIVRGLATLLEKGDVPKRLQGKKLYSLDFSSVISGTQFRGDLERRMKEVLDGVAAEGNIILFIDNIHEIVGAGRTGDSASDATSLLVPYIERRDIAFIGATTFEDYKKKLSDNSRDLAKNHRKPNYFYYAVPEGLIQPVEVPPYAGLIWILKEYHNESQGYVIKKQAPKLHAHKYSDGELKLAEKFWYNWQSDRRLRREAQRDRDSVYRSLQEELASKGQEMTYKRIELKLKCAEESRDQYLKESVANGRDLRITSMLLRRVRHELLQVKPDFDYDALEAEVEKIYGIKK